MCDSAPTRPPTHLSLAGRVATSARCLNRALLRAGPRLAPPALKLGPRPSAPLRAPSLHGFTGLRRLSTHAPAIGVAAGQFLGGGHDAFRALPLSGVRCVPR